MSKVVIIGGGIIGLSSALYLRKSGWDVTVIDKGDFSDNCSYGNAGYICPSHFIPLATPGIVKLGFKWMWNSKSPFYVQPRFDMNLISWGMKFMRSESSSMKLSFGEKFGYGLGDTASNFVYGYGDVEQAGT